MLTLYLPPVVFGQHLNKHIWNLTEFHLGFLQVYLFCGFCAVTIRNALTLKYYFIAYVDIPPNFTGIAAAYRPLALRPFLQFICTCSTEYAG